MKTTKVYSGPGYPIDPKLESERNLEKFCRVLETRSDIWLPTEAEISTIEKAVSSLLESKEGWATPHPNHLSLLRDGGFRDCRKRRQRKHGQRWVKYGVAS